MGVCGTFRPPVQGGSNELISKFLSPMILYNHPSYFKSGEINSCRLSPLPGNSTAPSEYLCFYHIEYLNRYPVGILAWVFQGESGATSKKHHYYFCVGTSAITLQ